MRRGSWSPGVQLSSEGGFDAFPRKLKLAARRRSSLTNKDHLTLSQKAESLPAHTKLCHTDVKPNNAAVVVKRQGAVRRKRSRARLSYVGNHTYSKLNYLATNAVDRALARGRSSYATIIYALQIIVNDLTSRKFIKEKGYHAPLCELRYVIFVDKVVLSRIRKKFAVGRTCFGVFIFWF